MNFLTAIGLLSQPKHRKTLARFFLTYPEPIDAFRRYWSKSGNYPCDLPVRLKISKEKLCIRLHNPHDFDTVNQIFCREDYPIRGNERVILDIGANIGVASLYFSKMTLAAKVFAYEPVPNNVVKFNENTRGCVGVQLTTAAVSDYAGTCLFATETTGRYGHLADSAASGIEVKVDDIATIVDEVIRAEGHIDLIKIDVEGEEERILKAIPERHLGKIGRIYAEYGGDYVPSGFVASQYGYVTHFQRDLC